MYCIKCGNELPDGANFCIKCGATVTNDKKGNDNINLRINKKLIIALPFVVLIVIIGGIFWSRQPKTEKEAEKNETDQATAFYQTNENAESDDLVAVESCVDQKGICTSDYYYIYDENGNLEYYLSVDNFPDGTIYMLFHSSYSKDGLELLKQVKYIDDWSESLEHEGLEDSIEGDYEIYQYNNGNLVYSESSSSTIGYCNKEYDSNNRLIRENHFSNESEGYCYEITYEYDENGNSIKESTKFYSGDEYCTEREFDSEGRIIKTISYAYRNIGNQSHESYYKYDGYGRLIDDGEYSYSYDGKGRLARKTSDDFEWTYTYVATPEESRKNLDVIKKIIDLDELEADAQFLLAKQRNFGTDAAGKEIEILNDAILSSNTSTDVDNIEASTMECLPDSIFTIIKGHYEDGWGNAVDIESPNKMTRFILGGHENHTYDEQIKGYEELTNGYYIFVEWDGDKYAYFYTLEAGVEKLYVDFNDEWNPNPSNFMRDIQCYTKRSYSTSNTAIALDDPWYGNDMSDGSSYEGGIPEEAFNHLKGIFLDESRTIEFISPYEIHFVLNGKDERNLEIYGCEVIDNLLYIYVTDGSYKNVYAISQDSNGGFILKFGPGHWQTEEFFSTATLYKSK